MPALPEGAQAGRRAIGAGRIGRLAWWIVREVVWAYGHADSIKAIAEHMIHRVGDMM
ncbi:hypothetical protein [Longispora fulva]|uniref:Uncharacterized protein n=1 Tax=Longispora fulva TaxID=619741 RepID=A0A8J7GD63_9ACTN|nr:hypothetical protein [Longispora fulva]MBG6138378.1 hypothetical protein [Longispora fulva]